ncbi:MAG: hypothetical protein K8S98_13565 [Planctomycetes bacterium]|nr:hypothetical protein [Planctomycetota bacterium]
MAFELRIRRDVAGEEVVSVDGAWDARGLNLSHWPGNRTPAQLTHELSTGIVLAFDRLDERERTRLVGDAKSVVNNHYDTDGVLALFAFLRPEEALKREKLLLDAAAAGDFFRAPSEAAIALDALIAAFADRDRSPIAARLAGLDGHARWELAARELVERLPALIDGGLEEHRALWQDAVASVARGRAELAHAAHDDLVHLDWSIWTARDVDAPFGPGRHALFGSTTRDRVLTLAPRREGTLCRFVVGTLSWFDGIVPRRLSRPELGMLAGRLNELEQCDPASAFAWRAQDTASPSPELWFGSEELEDFAEHNRALAPSRLAPSVIRRELGEALRRALVVPD